MTQNLEENSLSMENIYQIEEILSTLNLGYFTLIINLSSLCFQLGF